MTDLFRPFDEDNHIMPLAQVREIVVRKALERYSATEAAQHLSINRATIGRWMK